MAKLYGLMRLGRDAEIRHTPGGDAVANLGLAYNYGKKGDDGKRPTQWIEASLWGQRAESLAQYLTKGSLHLFTLDNVHIETYTDKDGYQAFKLVGTVVDVELGGSGNGGNEAGQGGSQAAPQRRPAAGGAAPKPQPKPSDMDDDIPF